MQEASSQGVQTVSQAVLVFLFPTREQQQRNRGRECKKGRDDDRKTARSCRAQGTGWCFDFEVFKGNTWQHSVP